MRGEALGGIRALDYLHGPDAMTLERIFEAAPCVAAIDEDMAQPGEADSFEDIRRAVAVLNIGGMLRSFNYR